MNSSSRSPVADALVAESLSCLSLLCGTGLSARACSLGISFQPRVLLGVKFLPVASNFLLPNVGSFPAPFGLSSYVKIKYSIAELTGLVVSCAELQLVRITKSLAFF